MQEFPVFAIASFLPLPLYQPPDGRPSGIFRLLQKPDIPAGSPSPGH